MVMVMVIPSKKCSKILVSTTRSCSFFGGIQKILFHRPNYRVLSIGPKIPTFSKHEQTVRKFHGEGRFQKIRKLLIFGKSNGTEISRKKLTKIWLYLRRRLSSAPLVY